MNRRMTGVGTARFSRIALIAAVALTIPALQPALAASSGECISVQIDAPFRLPDGLMRAPGALTLCDTRSYSPVAQLHVILVNGSTIGVFPSVRRSTEIGPVDAPEVVFERDAEGTLSLVGYILPVAGRSLAFRLKGQGESWQTATRKPDGGGTSAAAAAIIAAAAPR